MVKIERYRVGDEITSCYARMVKAGDLVFISGVGGRDPSKDDTFTQNGVKLAKWSDKGYAMDIETQMELIMKRIKSLLEKAGTTMDNVVHTRLFLDDIRDLAPATKILEKYWTKNPPTLQAYGGVQFGRITMRAELEVVAVMPD